VWAAGPVAGVVGIEVTQSPVINLESPGVGAPDPLPYFLTAYTASSYEAPFCILAIMCVSQNLI
jgi:hypothetical protein